MRLSRRTATRGVAWGGGGVAGAVAGVVGVLVAQASAARRAIGPQRAVPPYQDGRFGPPTGRSVRVALLGDSVAAGLGAEAVAETVSGVVVRGVMPVTGRPVTVMNHAVVGARSADLDRQVTRCLTARPDVAIIIVGANDVIHLVPRSRAARHLVEAIGRLRSAGCAVVVGTCPDLGTVRPVGSPLRLLARRLSRRLASAQRTAAAAAGAAAVSLHDALGPEFESNAEAYFAADLFHPSGLGYRRIAGLLLPEVLRALGVEPTTRRRELPGTP